MFHNQSWNADGTVTYSPYNRFPVGGYALLKLITLPFSDDLSATIYAARMLMLLFFAAAAVLAYLALLRLIDSTSNRWIALTTTLLVFSSPYCLYYNDMIHPKTSMDLFGVMLTFHGMVVFVQENRFRQLLFKTCVSLLLGWHVLALLLTFIVLGVVCELFRAGSTRSDHIIRKYWMASITKTLVGRYVLLGAVALLVGLSILTFNFANEWLAFNGSRTLTELPSFRSMLRRIGVDRAYAIYGGTDWPSFLQRQFSRLGSGISLPFSVANRAHDAAAMDPTAHWGVKGANIGYVVTGACLLSLAALAFVRRLRHGLLLATLPLSGFCWSLPMRYNVHFHDYESLFYLGIPLVLVLLLLVGICRLAGGRLLVGLAAAALLVFVSSAYEMARVGHDAETGEFQKAMLADFEAIRKLTEGNRVRAATHYYPPSKAIRFAGARHGVHYYLAGRSIGVKYGNNLDGTDFLISRHHAAGLPTLTPDNRLMFLYDSASLVEAFRSAYRSIRSDDPMSRSYFDLYLRDPGGDGSRQLSYVKEPCKWTDTLGRFYVNITPVDSDDLADHRREHGFESLDFDFRDEFGLRYRGRCMVTVDLPDYEIASIATGQRACRSIPACKDRPWEASFYLDRLSGAGHR